jgi:hypothetical protein
VQLYRYFVSPHNPLYVASQRVFIVVVYFVIDSVRKILDTPTYTSCQQEADGAHVRTGELAVTHRKKAKAMRVESTHKSHAPHGQRKQNTLDTGVNYDVK